MTVSIAMAWSVIGMAITGLVAIASIRELPFFPPVDSGKRTRAIAAIAVVLLATLAAASIYVIFA